MDKTQILVSELLIADIDKLIEKYQKKAEKEKAKVKDAYVTYHGEKYYSETDLMEAYSCDVFSGTVYDRLVTKLEKTKMGLHDNMMTDSEMVVLELQSRKYELQLDLKADKEQKERREKTDARIKELCSEGYSYREAETIVSNERLMEYE